jgi:predicted transport protein
MANTDLAKKLQIKVGNRIGVVNAPADFTLGNLPQDVTLVMGAEPELDVALLFAQDSEGLKRDAAALLSALKPHGIFWIAYPKKTSGLKTDLTRDEGWQVLAPLSLTPVTNIALDVTWSGLRWKRAEHDSPESQLDAQYAGGKEHLRPIGDKLVEMGLALGDDVTLNVRQGYVALVRGKQFAAIAPTTKTRVDLGLRLKGLDSPLSGRVTEGTNIGGGSITHKISLASVDEIDTEVKTLLWSAYHLVG